MGKKLKQAEDVLEVWYKSEDAKKLAISRYEATVEMKKLELKSLRLLYMHYGKKYECRLNNCYLALKCLEDEKEKASDP